MFDRINDLLNQFDELDSRLSAPDLYDDPERATRLLRERTQLEPIVLAYKDYTAAKQLEQDALDMISDPDLREMAQEELATARADIARLEEELKILLLPKDPNDDKNILVEIRGGAGGEESALFARSLWRMYSMYAEKRGWSVDVISLNETFLGGCKEVVFEIAGAGAYSRM